MMRIETIKEKIKPYLPNSFLFAYRQCWGKYFFYKNLRSIDPKGRKLYKLSQAKTYSDILLQESSEQALKQVKVAARRIYGDKYNYYSDALRREVVHSFEKSIGGVPEVYEKIHYLEIGSAQGLSMSVVSLILRYQKRLGNLVSVDPYFLDGYYEGKYGPYAKEVHVNLNKQTKTSAMEVYNDLRLDVKLLEMTSVEGLRELMRLGKRFHLIYIDGSHERFCPTNDFSLSYNLLENGGVIMLDDYLWPDVKPVKLLCDKYATKIYESWKIASYRFDNA